VEGVRRRGPSKVILEMSSEGEARRIIDDQGLKKRGLKAPSVTLSRPRVMIFDVPRALSEAGKLQEAMLKQNRLESCNESLESEMKILFKWGPRDGERVNLVCEVNPRLRKELLGEGRIYLGWSTIVGYLGALGARCMGMYPSSAGQLGRFVRDVVRRGIRRRHVGNGVGG